jgi:N-acetylneuraminic acid mutarotase
VYDTATLLGDGHVLVVGGGNVTGSPLALASAELYDSGTNSWGPAAPMATPRYGQTATSLGNGKVLVTGGRDNSNNVLSSAELYDPASNTWSSAGSMAKARTDQTATLLNNGKVLVAGGWQVGALSSAELYDPVSNTWSSAGSMATARYSQTATLLANGSVLVVGGNPGAPLSSAELYDPATNIWSVAGSLATARVYHTATLLGNGKVLVAGGGYNGELASAELYDPGNNSWSPAASLSTARGWASATLLANGQVLVTGGWNSTNNDLSSSLLYDPTNNTWSPTGSLLTPRDSQTATLLPTGQVLAIGGETLMGTSYVALSSAELYQSGPTFVITSPGTVTAGGTSNFSVTAEDANGFTLTGYTGTVHFTSNDPNAILPADYTFTSGPGLDNGVHTFSATLKTAGLKSLMVTDSANSLSGQASIYVNAAAATNFVLSGPISVATNRAFSVTVTAYDAYGNVATGYRGTVHFSDSATGATLPANYTFTASDNGVHTFAVLKLKQKGMQTLTVVDTLVGSLIGTWTINVT